MIYQSILLKYYNWMLIVFASILIVYIQFNHSMSIFLDLILISAEIVFDDFITIAIALEFIVLSWYWRHNGINLINNSISTLITVFNNSWMRLIFSLSSLGTGFLVILAVRVLWFSHDILVFKGGSVVLVTSISSSFFSSESSLPQYLIWILSFLNNF